MTTTDTTDAIALFAAAVWQPADVIEVRRLPSERCTWHRADRLRELAPALTRDNAAAQNIYIGANPRTAAGRKGDNNVATARSLCADHDSTRPDDAAARANACAMPPPTLTLDSGHGVHQYWRLLAPLAPTLWRDWQRDLAALLGSDTTIHNPERVLRLPGFLNVKREPVPCRIIECDPARIYDLADLPIPMRPGSDTPPPVFRVRRERDRSEIGDPFERCRAYLLKCPNAIAFSNGHRTTWHAANTCNRFGLTRDEAADMMRWYSATKCDPPWSEKEITHKVTQAYTRNAGQHGQKLHDDRRPLFAVRRENGEAA